MQVPSGATPFSLSMPDLPRDVQVPEKKQQCQEQASSVCFNEMVLPIIVFLILAWFL